MCSHCRVACVHKCRSVAWHAGRASGLGDLAGYIRAEQRELPGLRKSSHSFANLQNSVGQCEVASFFPSCQEFLLKGPASVLSTARRILQPGSQGRSTWVLLSTSLDSSDSSVTGGF